MIIAVMIIMLLYKKPKSVLALTSVTFCLEVISIGKQPSSSYAFRALEKLCQFLTDPR